MENNFDELEKEIISILDSFLNDAKDGNFFGDESWTKTIKKKIGELGHHKNYNVSMSGFKEKFESEWLFDIVWYDEDEQERLTKIPLIVESEWSRSYGGIKTDFEKLIIARAEKKMLICQCLPEETDELVSKLKLAVSAFKGTQGDRYFIAVLDRRTENEFKYFAFDAQN